MFRDETNMTSESKELREILAKVVQAADRIRATQGDGERGTAISPELREAVLSYLHHTARILETMVGKVDYLADQNGAADLSTLDIAALKESTQKKVEELEKLMISFQDPPGTSS
jgi:hypothetical protein